MIRKTSLWQSFLPLFNHRPQVSKLLFIYSLVLLAFSTVAFNFFHFGRTTKTPLQISPRTEPSHDITEKQKALEAPKNPKDDPKALFAIPPVPQRSSNDHVIPVRQSVIQAFLNYEPREYKEKVLILTPIHNVARLLPRFGRLLRDLSYPHELISVVFGEDCSGDGTLSIAKDVASNLKKTFKRVEVHHFNITGQVRGIWTDVHNIHAQRKRRGHIAQARNLLLKAGLKDEAWVLWIDSDVTQLPPDIIQQLLSSDKDIVVPSCLFQSDMGQLRIFDKNTWRETPESIAKQKHMKDGELMLEGYGLSNRIFLPHLRAEGRVVPIDGVGGCTLLIKADCHRKGLIFPETVVDHHIETEGLAKLAKQMGFGVYGMPFVNVIH
ncbi:mannan polymerase complex subunit mnn9-like [Haliotis rufescens]|uniref:mannan polymerase complex subunit mnn9-like n=1 Tax=Haliotis rufescens TaxID=6454 RepID=UPI00201F7D89|nr:mannan polymerase complex subunit mnn9-like [Haliotis rufescens]XP_046378885.2 mannan polymerase complex subunit mnn9-like [Haliotis rufescens]XP_046378886.2 mannan polymerase complex subunit mnn9-like [Haliotis rufescens]